jgi:hypothetical protein
MNKNIRIVEDYFRGWETSDRALIKLSDNLKHSSPDGIYNSCEAFINDCWKYAGISNQNELQVINSGDYVCARYNTQTPDGKTIRVCEWFKIENGLITEIEVFYDRS